jgi:hypothetical protein
MEAEPPGDVEIAVAWALVSCVFRILAFSRTEAVARVSRNT